MHKLQEISQKYMADVREGFHCVHVISDLYLVH